MKKQQNHKVDGKKMKVFGCVRESKCKCECSLYKKQESKKNIRAGASVVGGVALIGAACAATVCSLKLLIIVIFSLFFSFWLFFMDHHISYCGIQFEGSNIRNSCSFNNGCMCGRCCYDWRGWCCIWFNSWIFSNLLNCRGSTCCYREKEEKIYGTIQKWNN